jgi:hypothetical protein
MAIGRGCGSVEIPSGGCGVCRRIRSLGMSMYRRDDRSGGQVDQTITVSPPYDQAHKGSVGITVGGSVSRVVEKEEWEVKECPQNTATTWHVGSQ